MNPPRDPTPRPRPSVAAPVDPRRAAPSARVAVVFAGGDQLSADEHAQLRDQVDRVGSGTPLVIGADSGVGIALAGGWPVHVAVGDFDSIDPEDLARAETAGAEVRRHPVAKAATDLELAIDDARDAGVDRIVVAGIGGGRIDHLLANLLLLASDRYEGTRVSAQFGPGWVHIVRDGASWTAGRGDLVSILALGGPARGVTTRGLLYPLRDEDLQPGSTRGVSNEHADADASVSVREGVVAVIVPGLAGSHIDAPPTDSSSSPAPPEPSPNQENPRVP